MGRASFPRFVRVIGVSLIWITALSVPMGCQKTDDLLDPSGSNSNSALHAIYRSDEDFTDNPVILDGQAVEKEWGSDAAGYGYLNVRVSMEEGVGHPRPQAYVSMKAVYTDHDVYLLVKWVDSYPDRLKDVMVYVGEPLDSLGSGCQPSLVSEGNWVRNYRGLFDEDGLALAFEVDTAGSAIGTYGQRGCLTACHEQETPKFGRTGYGTLDVWQWMAARTNPLRDLYDRDTELPGRPLRGIPAYLDDLFADMVAGLQGDPGVPCYRANFQPGGNAPLYVYRLGDDTFNSPFCPAGGCSNVWGEKPFRQNGGVDRSYLWREDRYKAFAEFGGCDTIAQISLGHPEASAVDDVETTLALLRGPREIHKDILKLETEQHKWRRGYAVTGWLLNYPEESRADVHGKAGYDEDMGIWTLEIGRRLKTADAVHDVTFDPSSGKSYTFTVAVMDNSGDEHIGSEPQTLVFDPKGGRR